MTYKSAVLFDLDGTLVDTAADFIAVLNNMRQIDNLPLLNSEIIRNTVSDGSKALITLAYQLEENDHGFEEKRQWLLDLYEQELGKNSALFNGFETLLTTFEDNNIAWGIITNKPARFTLPLLAHLNINPSNNVAICPDHVAQTKPHPEPLLLAAKKLNLNPMQCVYVGDHQRDIEAGRNAGMKTIACSYGYIKPGDSVNNWQADIIVNSVADFSQFIKQHLGIH